MHDIFFYSCELSHFVSWFVLKDVKSKSNKNSNKAIKDFLICFFSFFLELQKHNQLTKILKLPNLLLVGLF